MRELNNLLVGYGRFRLQGNPTRHETYRALAGEGQSPKIMVVGCCDSRVDPAIIFDAGPGELFVARNVANVVPPYIPNRSKDSTAAAIEFAVTSLCVAHIVVMGHASCGGIAALIDGTGRALSDNSMIGSWISVALPALQKNLKSNPGVGTDKFARTLEKAVIAFSLDNLRGFPFVCEAMAAGRLQVHGAWFDIESEELQLMDAATGAFAPVMVRIT